MPLAPLSKAGWLSWLDQEPTALDEALQVAKSGARRAVNLRVTPRPDVPQKDPKLGLKPDTDTHRPVWARKLCNGWHALLLKDTGTRIVIFVVCCARKFVAFGQALSLCVPEARNTCWFTPIAASVCVQEARNSCWLTLTAALI